MRASRKIQAISQSNFSRAILAARAAKGRATETAFQAPVETQEGEDGGRGVRDV